MKRQQWQQEKCFSVNMISLNKKICLISRGTQIEYSLNAMLHALHPFVWCRIGSVVPLLPVHTDPIFG